MKQTTVDLCWGGSGNSWLEESEDEKGQYYKVNEVDIEIKKLREALEKIITTLERNGNGFFLCSQVSYAIKYAKEALKDGQ